MNFRKYSFKQHTDSTWAYRVLFFSLIYCYIFHYQNDLFTIILYHIIHSSHSHIPALILISYFCLLILLQYCISRKFHFAKQHYWCTFLPSFCLLALTNHIALLCTPSHHQGLWQCIPTVAVSAILFLWHAPNIGQHQAGKRLRHFFPSIFQKQTTDKNTPSFPSFFINCTMLTLMMAWVANQTTSNTALYYQAKMEKLTLEKRYAEVIQTGANAPLSYHPTALLLFYALEKEHKLGDELFRFPIRVSSEALLAPHGKDRFLYVDSRSMVHELKSTPNPDVRLASLLMDRKLDDFAAQVVKSKKLSDLPTHYREALFLYTHLRSTPIVNYQNDVLDADFEDFQKMAATAHDDKKKISLLRDSYGTTYWFYYLYPDY